jgi:hypothetical protein
MAFKRCVAAAALVLSPVVLTGCNIDIEPTLPPVTMQFQYPLLPGIPIATDLLLPAIDLCSTVSEEAINDLLTDIPFGRLLANSIDVQEVAVTRAVMEGKAPEGASFQGFTEVSFLENNRVLLQATPGNGIEGNRIVLEADDPVNLWEVLEQCPERESELTVRARGLMPLNAPTRWETRVTIRIKARVSPF